MDELGVFKSLRVFIILAESEGILVLCTPCDDHHQWWHNLSEHITEVKMNVRNASCYIPRQVDCVLIFRKCMPFARVAVYWSVRLLNETLCCQTTALQYKLRTWALQELMEPGCRLESWRT